MSGNFSRRFVIGSIFPAAIVGLVWRGTAKGADQPHMQAALDHLRAAKVELDAATPDKGGHRAKALALTKDAITEVERGIEYDRRH